MQTHIFRLECLTDMHVGNGEANYSIIDNEVQKDTVLQDVAIIHASGVKGAIKDYFVRRFGNDDEQVKAIFGDKEGTGTYKFFTALCIARPLRVTDGNAAYVLATSRDILAHFKYLLDGLGRTDAYQQAVGELVDGREIEVEGDACKLQICNATAPLIRKEFVVLDSMKNHELPVRARNVLDANGISKNLWYEELVPHKSVFVFEVITPDNDSNYAMFKEAIEQTAIQFGANASIGNGYATVTEVYSCE